MIKVIFGWVFFLSPFIIMFIALGRGGEWKEVIKAYLLVFSMIGMFTVGCYLLGAFN